uniref:Uncharacterized protein n=1 Tax=Palpitomonas bilix TaxID=652834 RepID=A0A7S3CY45_9EUKA|mmetsp:Transcript_12897/g.34005  ORF Transcript_12897/g.34005 Transcript_12897/m.34005 type:complete len:310 (+) Transcript_12897:585-1514(+)
MNPGYNDSNRREIGSSTSFWVNFGSERELKEKGKGKDTDKEKGSDKKEAENERGSKFENESKTMCERWKAMNNGEAKQGSTPCCGIQIANATVDMTGVPHVDKEFGNIEMTYVSCWSSNGKLFAFEVLTSPRENLRLSGITIARKHGASLRFQQHLAYANDDRDDDSDNDSSNFEFWWRVLALEFMPNNDNVLFSVHQLHHLKVTQTRSRGTSCLDIEDISIFLRVWLFDPSTAKYSIAKNFFLENYRGTAPPRMFFSPALSLLFISSHEKNGVWKYKIEEARKNKKELEEMLVRPLLYRLSCPSSIQW